MSIRVLVVDDDPMMHMLYQAHFKKEMDSKEAIFVFKSSGPDALEYLKENSFEVLITDINMPEMSGFELIAEIKKTVTEIKIIVISGFEKYKETAEGLESVSFLKKPIQINALKKLIFK